MEKQIFLTTTRPANFEPGDQLVVSGCVNSSVRGPFKIASVSGTEINIRPVAWWRKWLYVARHPYTYYQLRRDPVKVLVAHCRKLFGMK